MMYYSPLSFWEFLLIVTTNIIIPPHYLLLHKTLLIRGNVASKSLNHDLPIFISYHLSCTTLS
jgi:hypothetical protein